jgi:CheY-like chemotaxis protein
VPNPNRKILVVDDNPAIRLLIRLALHGEFEVVEASDGATALALAREHHPDLAILDIMMPGGMDGLQVLDQIKADPELKQIVCAMVTARGQAEDVEAGKARGADHYFIKPFSPSQLVDWVKTRLAGGAPRSDGDARRARFRR